MNKIITCKDIADLLLADIKSSVDNYTKYGYTKPLLTAIIVGNDPASNTYVKNKEKACDKANIISEVIRLPESSTTEDVIKVINKSHLSDGIIVQRPLPKHIDEQAVAIAIPHQKDVDGFHPYNLGMLIIDPRKCTNVPATPLGIMHILSEYDIPLHGKNAVVLGRSSTVGTPLGVLLTKAHCNVTVLHSKTSQEDVIKYCKDADIIVSAVGKESFVTKDMIADNKEVCLIDVGINRNSEGKLCGDINHEVYELDNVRYTTVPGGVGPLTVASLISNTYDAFKRTLN